MEKGYDFTSSTIAPEALGAHVVQNLGVKGFCVFLPGIPDSTIEKVRGDAEELRSKGLLDIPPKEIVDGLLGDSGSSLIAELDAPDADASQRRCGENLSFLDQTLTQLGLMTMPYLEAINVSFKARTIGMLHAGGEELPEDVEPREFTTQDCAKWLTVFAEHKLMLLMFLGPDPATLELRPYVDDAEATQVRLKPGAMVALRADLMARTLISDGRSLSLTCFLQGHTQLGKRKPEAPLSSPVAQQLEEWARQRIQNIKEADPLAAADIPMPRRWEKYMHHIGITTQPVGIRSIAGRCASSWDMDKFMDATGAAGPDLATTVPYLRWNHAEIYDAEAPEGQEYVSGTVDPFVAVKTYTQHATFMDGLELFDNSAFRMSKSEAQGVDPGQRQLLEVGFECLVRAGYEKKLMNSRGGVYCAADGRVEFNHTPKEVSGGGGVCGAGNSIACGRFSFVHGMKGPCHAFDQDVAGSLCATAYASTQMTQLGQWNRVPFGIVYSYAVCTSRLLWLMFSLSDRMSRTGRNMSFDDFADGYIRGEAVGCIMLKPMVDGIDMQSISKGDDVARQCPDFDEFYAEFAGIGSNHSGKAASLSSADVSAQQEAIQQALTKAEISPYDVEYVDCHAMGAKLHDAVETTALGRSLRPDGLMGADDETNCLNLGSLKTSLGCNQDCQGLMSIMRVAKDIANGTMSPVVHLRQLNAYIDMPYCDRPVMIGTEVVDFELPTSYAGCQAMSVGGMNVHALMWSHYDTKRHPPIGSPAAQEAFYFWPAGGGNLESEEEPDKGYWICGSWSLKGEPQPMTAARDGAYTFTATLGSERWETFQILLDADRTKVLHPGSPCASKVAPVLGPDNEDGNYWSIFGKPIGSGASAGGATALANEDMGLIAADLDRVKSFGLGDEDVGEPGDQYEITLQVSGKWRNVTWRKLGTKATPPETRFFIVGSWDAEMSAWEEMMPSSTPGEYVKEVTLAQRQETFYISRNGSWSQAFLPEGHDVIGPTSATYDSAGWSLRGIIGDKFSVKLVLADGVVTSVESVRL